MLDKLEQRYWELYMYDAKVILIIMVLLSITISFLITLIVRAL